MMNLINHNLFPVENPLINTCGAISLASLQPPLITVPPLQPRPATTGSLDLMLPLQPKLLPGYNLQSSYLSNTLSTVRPPDIEFKPNQIIQVVVEKDDSEISVFRNSQDSKKSERNSSEESDVEKSSSPKSSELDNDNANNYTFEINSNVIDNKETFSDVNDESPNNNSY